MMLGPKAQALSYHVPTKYLFLPSSQAQSLEIPLLNREHIEWSACGLIARKNSIGATHVVLLRVKLIPRVGSEKS